MREGIDLVPGTVYVVRANGWRVRYLGLFDAGAGQWVLQFRDLLDGGTFFRHADEAEEFLPAPDEAEALPTPARPVGAGPS